MISVASFDRRICVYSLLEVGLKNLHNQHRCDELASEFVCVITSGVGICRG